MAGGPKKINIKNIAAAVTGKMRADSGNNWEIGSIGNLERRRRVMKKVEADYLKGKEEGFGIKLGIN